MIYPDVVRTETMSKGRVALTRAFSSANEELSVALAASQDSRRNVKAHNQ
jgi:hypothetical protein